MPTSRGELLLRGEGEWKGHFVGKRRFFPAILGFGEGEFGALEGGGSARSRRGKASRPGIVGEERGKRARMGREDLLNSFTGSRKRVFLQGGKRKNLY